MQKKVIILISLLLLLLIPMSFAADNETVSQEDAINPLSAPIEDGDVLTASNDYYFNASAESDGDGSQNNPYKYLTADRIKANANIYLADGEYTLDASKNIEKVNIYGSNVEKTIITYSGVGFRVSSSLTIQNVTFCDMSITNYGTLTANNTVFSYGYGSSYDSNGNNFGGAIYVHEDYSNARVTVNNCTFKHNFAVYGGAIYMGNGYLEIIDSIFDLNMAYNYGGAIACENTKSVIISKSKFYNSVSMGDAGGAIYLKGTDFSATNIEIANSSATFGSAITSLKTNVTLTGINCENNIAKWDGGAIYHFYGDFSLTGSRFTNNSARNGGALFIDNSTSCYLISNTFNYNNASHTGGAIYSILNKFKTPLQYKNYYNYNNAYFMSDIFDTSEINMTIGSGNYSMYKANPSEIDVLPSKFSLLDGNYVSSVKDQQSGGNCWAFSAMAVIESVILKINGDNLDLSEENMKNLMALYSDYGWTIDVNGGGYDYMTLGYLTSWLGPVLESEDLTDDKSALSPVLNSILHIQNILFLKRDNYTDNDAIKRALMQYGGVGTGIAYYSAYINSNSYYCYSSMPCNHAVTIVGWDDNYSKNNFKWAGSIGDGAWIVKNSWGSNWGDNGYFYVSYYDMNFAKPGDSEASYTVIFNDSIKFDKNYQYDIQGMTDYFLNSTSYVWYKNVFKATDDEYLAGVSTYFQKATEWAVSISVNGDYVHYQEGKSAPGYFTIDLNKLVTLKSGDVFEVIFNINVEGEAAFPVSEKVRYNKMAYAPEISYVSYDGQNWLDLYELSWAYSSHSYASQVACIKAFTVLNEIATTLNLSVDFNGNPANITAVVYNQYGNPLNGGEVTFNVNNEEYRVDVKNGVAQLPYYFTNTFNNIYAKFENVGYISSSNYASLEIVKSQLGVDFKIDRTVNNVVINIIAKDKINSDALLFVNDDVYQIRFINGRYSMDLDDLENGIYNISVRIAFPDDSIYVNTTADTSFKIDVKHTKLICKNLTVSDEDDIIYSVHLLDENDNPLVNKYVILIIGDDIYDIATDINGQANITFRLNPAVYTAEVLFMGDNDYVSSKNYSRIDVKCHVIVNADITQNINNVALNIYVSKHINDTVTVTINNKTEYVEVNDGIGLLNIDNLDNGVYVVNITLNESKYSFDEFSTSFAINVKNTKIVAGDVTITDGDTFNYTIKLLDVSNNALSNKSIEVVIAKITYNVITDENGDATVPIKLTQGVYKSDIRFNGDNDYFGANSSSTIKVKTKVGIDLTVDKYGDEASFTIRLSVRSTGFLTLTINNESTTLRFVNGIVKYQLSDLANGKYDVSVDLDDSNYVYEKTASSFTVDMKNTQIRAEDLTITDEDLVNYTVYLVDGDGNAVLNKSIVVTLNEVNYNVVTGFDGKAIIPLDLEPGVYTASVAFNGDDSYFKSLNSSVITVKNRVFIDLVLNQFANNVTLVVSLSEPLNDTLTVVINNKSHEIGISDGFGQLDLVDLTNDVYYYGIFLNEEVYDFNEISSQFVVDVRHSQITAGDLIAVEGDLAVLNITLADENGNPISNRTIEVNINGTDYSAVTGIYGNASIPINLEPGVYTASVAFNGDDSYFKSLNSSVITVKNRVFIDLVLNQFANNVTLVVSLSEPLNDTLTVVINNKSHEIGISDGFGQLDLVDLTNDVYYYGIFLNEEVYDFNEISSQFVVDVRHSQIIADDLVVVEGDLNFFNVTLVDENNNPIVNRSVRFNLNGTDYVQITDNNGQTGISFDLAGGNYEVKTSFDADNNYFKTDSTNKIKVKTVLNVVLGYTTMANDYIIQLNSSNPMNETLLVRINNVTYHVQINNYANRLVLNKLSNGVYDVSVSLKDNDDFYFENITSQFVINKLESKIISQDIVAYHNGKTSFSVRLVDVNNNPLAGKLVAFTLNGKRTVALTNGNGFATFEFELPVGNYTVLISYSEEGYSYYGCETSQTISVRTTIIENESQTKTFNSKYAVKFLDKNGNPINNSGVTFILDDVEYDRITDENGYAYLDIKLNAGTYKLSIINDWNNETLTKTINVVSRITNNKNLIIYEYSKKAYKVRIFDDNGNPVGANEKVTIIIAGKSTTVRTDVNGYASFKVNLQNKVYTLKATYKGFTVSNKITVKSKLVTANMVYKRANSYRYQAKLLDNNGKIVKNKKITFKIKGKTFTAKTNSKGIAIVTINLKLAVGSYKITTIFGNCKETNTIKIKK